MQNVIWRLACLAVVAMMSGCGKGERFQQSMPLPPQPTLSAVFAVPAAGHGPKKVISRERCRRYEVREAELARLILDEPAPGAIVKAEALPDGSFILKLSQNEQVLLAELIHQ